METIISKKELPVIEEIRKFLETLTDDEQKNINIFIQGVKFAKQTAEKDPAA